MQYKIIDTDLMIKGKLYNENSTIELDSIPEGLEQFLVPVNDPIKEVPLIQESALSSIQESEQKIENNLSEKIQVNSVTSSKKLRKGRRSKSSSV